MAKTSKPCKFDKGGQCTHSNRPQNMPCHRQNCPWPERQKGLGSDLWWSGRPDEGQTKFMPVEDALQIVVDLAGQGVLSDSMVGKDDDLKREQKKQQTAINTIEDFATNVVAENLGMKLTNEDLVSYLEIAKMEIATDHQAIKNRLDVSDEEFDRLRAQLNKIMEEK